jgi:CheY-like chemotaxis protein
MSSSHRPNSRKSLGKHNKGPGVPGSTRIRRPLDCRGEILPAAGGKRIAAPNFQKGKDTAMTDVAKPRILVVEDDPDLRRILKLQLTSMGYEITEAENGAEGFKSIQNEVPDCVILDLMMPVMDGFGFLKRTRSIMGTKDVPILILTASEDERNRVRGFQYQADAYMSKPYDLEKLTDQVEKLMASTPAAQPA